MVKGDRVKCLRGPCSDQKNGESNIEYLKRLCASYLITNDIRCPPWRILVWKIYKIMYVFLKNCFRKQLRVILKITLVRYTNVLVCVWVMHNKPFFVHNIIQY